MTAIPRRHGDLGPRVWQDRSIRLLTISAACAIQVVGRPPPASPLPRPEDHPTSPIFAYVAVRGGDFWPVDQPARRSRTDECSEEIHIPGPPGLVSLPRHHAIMVPADPGDAGGRTPPATPANEQGHVGPHPRMAFFVGSPSCVCPLEQSAVCRKIGACKEASDNASRTSPNRHDQTLRKQSPY